MKYIKNHFADIGLILILIIGLAVVFLIVSGVIK